MFSNASSYTLIQILTYNPLSSALSTVSTAPKHYSQPDPNTKMSKNKKKKLKKKQKAKQALLETQMRELEEMEEKEARQALETCDITTNTTGECVDEVSVVQSKITMWQVTNK